MTVQAAPGVAPGDGLGAGRARIERLDAQAVIGLADQPLVERGAFQRRLDQLAPVRLRWWREIRRRGEGRSVIGGKMP